MRRLRPFFPDLRLLLVVGMTLAVCLCGQADAKGRARRHARPPRAAAPHTTVAPAPATPPAPALWAPGMIVAVDPETGALVLPSPAEVQRLRGAERTGLLRSSAGLVEQRFPDGTVMVDLQGRFREFTVVQADPSGRPRFECVHDAAALERLLGPCVPAPTPVFVEK